MPTGLGPIIETEAALMLDDETTTTEPAFDGPSVRGPEWWLLYAILKDVSDLLEAKTSKDRAVMDALAWISDETGDARWYFTFETVCDVLGMDPVAVRRALRRKALRRNHTGRQAANRHVMF